MKKKLFSQSRLFTVLIHFLIWAALFFIPLLFLETREGQHRFLLFGNSMLVLMAGYFYFNYLYLIPEFLLRKRIIPYVVLLFIGLVAISAMNVVYNYFIHLYVIPNSHHHTDMHYAMMTIYPAILAFGLSTSIRITDEWFKNERQKKEMENEKLTAELAFLKSQVNPHFLFNILNNICSLARKKSEDTENAIIKLSQIMRYMLFESKDEKVSLDKEIEYLQNYIELQRMRISDKVQISFSVEGDPEKLLIEPMLLIPFVENAFKHGISYLDESKILIRISLTDKDLLLTVVNNNVKKGDEAIPSETGIGLKNVLRRLELLYPEKHTLTIEDNGSLYKVNLNMNLSA
jgi:two-component system, LytTR family, sensor kinase